EKFLELGGGASLWMDFPFGQFLTFSAGTRVAFIYLARNFVGHPELPSQNFFTLTPGLTTALRWQFSSRFSAVARARLNYLFYNVDGAQNLGYFEGALGVDYAF